MRNDKCLSKIISVLSMCPPCPVIGNYQKGTLGDKLFKYESIYISNCSQHYLNGEYYLEEMR